MEGYEHWSETNFKIYILDIFYIQIIQFLNHGNGNSQTICINSWKITIGHKNVTFRYVSYWNFIFIFAKKLIGVQVHILKAVCPCKLLTFHRETNPDNVGNIHPLGDEQSYELNEFVEGVHIVNGNNLVSWFTLYMNSTRINLNDLFFSKEMRCIFQMKKKHRIFAPPKGKCTVVLCYVALDFVVLLCWKKWNCILFCCVIVPGKNESSFICWRSWVWDTR